MKPVTLRCEEVRHYRGDHSEVRLSAMDTVPTADLTLHLSSADAKAFETGSKYVLQLSPSDAPASPTDPALQVPELTGATEAAVAEPPAKAKSKK